MTDLTWEDPPERAPVKRKSTWEPVLAQLRERPGTWAVVARKRAHATAASTAANIRAGLVGRAARGEFEARSRKVSDDEYVVYARYVGNQT